MTAPKNLEEIYQHELQDLWSANDQMKAVVKRLAAKATDSTLTDRLNLALDGIQQHTDMVKQFLVDRGADVSKEHCKGMEGLCKEAVKHAIDENFDDGAVRDVVIIAQYQRMCHYGICGFGTAKAFATALGHDDHVARLDAITAKIYDADENLTALAEHSVNLKAG